VLLPDREALRVLVVEDQPTIREAIAATLAREPGFTVHQAGSLIDARAKLSGVDLAILDLGLPDGDGAELIQELKALNPQAQAIVLTSSIDPADTHRTLARGAAIVLNKLDGFENLLAAVKRLQQNTSSGPS
jgi:DNA-binding NarL/FixJ family response regulator